MVKVKICGITNLKDALAAVGAGCDALGFVFYKKSPRYITPAKAAGIIRCLPAGIIKIGVFVDASEKTIKRISTVCRLDLLQFHGHETAGFCKKFRGLKIIKAFRIRNKEDLACVLDYKVFAYLFDAFSRSGFGGTGKKFDWKLLRHLKKPTRPVFLSGGLTARNVGKAISLLHPDWVDACTSLEATPGKKNHKKLKAFISRAKNN